MSHHHVGPEDVACSGCLREANSDTVRMIRAQRRNTILGLTLLIAMVIGAMYVLSRHLSG